mgnify:CR=1 FL=1
MKKDIRSFSEEQLCDFFVQKGHKSFRGQQVYEWLWKKSANTFENMTNISLPLRKILDDMEDSQAIEFLIERLKSSKTNEEFFSAMKSGNGNGKKK